MLIKNKITLICATEAEMKSVIEEMLFYKIDNSVLDVYFSEKYDIAIVISGVGKVNAGFCTQWIISNLKPLKIINIGFCGSLYKKFKIGDIIIPNETKYWDVDLVKFGYTIGQIPNCPPFFPLKKLHIKNMYSDNGDILCLSGDSFVDREFINIVKYANTKTIIDMELAAIAQVCFHNQYINYFSIKVVSDYSLLNNDSAKSYSKNIKICSNVVKTIVKQLGKYSN